MSSKIFKSSYMSDSSRLEIEASIASTSFHITHCTVVGEKSFMFDNTTAPALALAILEAAGYDDMADDANLADVHAFNAMHKLQESVDTQERATAEAKEQAELEAEALELFNASRVVRGLVLIEWVSVTKSERDEWLAVARKAREMRAEK